MNTRVKSSLLFLWTTIIFTMIAWPTPECHDCNVFTWYDKIAHLFLFGIFSYLLALLIKAKSSMKVLFIIITALVISAFYSALCEFIQIFVPGRTVSLYDFFAGMIGSLFSLIIFYEYFKNKKA